MNLVTNVEKIKKGGFLHFELFSFGLSSIASLIFSAIAFVSVKQCFERNTPEKDEFYSPDSGLLILLLSHYAITRHLGCYFNKMKKSSAYFQ